jgi:hypothetical protein
MYEERMALNKSRQIRSTACGQYLLHTRNKFKFKVWYLSSIDTAYNNNFTTSQLRGR